MNTPVARLLERLDLQQGDTSEAATDWLGETGEGSLNMSNRLFGGNVVAQAVVAAGRTYPDHRVHSVQQVFLRAGSGDLPIRYRVERLHSGRTYASVRVEVHQGDQIISHAQVGLTSGIDGPDRHDDAPPLPPLTETVNRDEVRQRPGWQDVPVEMRIDPATMHDGLPTMTTWVRPVGTMPADELMHKAVMAYASDRGLMTVAWRPHGDNASFKAATLDHSIWFHRPVRFDDWHSYLMRSPSIADGRGLSQGSIHHQDGTLVATTTQQGTFRPI